MEDKKKSTPICPITITPVTFSEKPIEFIAYRKDSKGQLHEEVVNNPLLANSIIPSEISFEQMEKFLNQTVEETECRNGTVYEKEKTDKAVEVSTIVRARNEIAELTNYELRPLLKRIYQNRDGEIDFSLNEIMVEIIIKEKHRISKATFLIKNTEVDKITKIVGKKYPTAIIYNKKDAERVENDFREKTFQINSIKCYIDAGWQKIGNTNVFVHKSYKLPNADIITTLNLPSDSQYQKKDIVDIWRVSLSIYNSYEVAAVLSIYSFLGITYKLFDEAGFPPHFLLFMSGKTGSLKTTIAKILYVQLADDKHRDFPRRIDADTQTSFERALVLTGYDTVTLIDDYSPAKSVQKKRDMANNLEAIIRMVGDGSTKSRSNIALDDCRGKGVRGMVVLTGELRGRGLSSNLRCLYCEMEREMVNLETVTWFQKNKCAYTTLLQHFANFLSAEWLKIVLYIKEQIDPKRHEAEKYIKERRLVDTLTTLWIMAEIIGWFLNRYCGVNDKTMANEITLMQKDIIGVVVRSEILSKQENPARVFMEAVATMISIQKIHIAEERILAVQLNVLDGFEEEGYIYLLPDNVYQKVTSWLKTGGLYFGTDMNQLGSLLCGEGYAVPTSNGANKKLNYARIDVGEGRKVKFLKIPKEVISKLQETAGQNE